MEKDTLTCFLPLSKKQEIEKLIPVMMDSIFDNWRNPPIIELLEDECFDEDDPEFMMSVTIKSEKINVAHTHEACGLIKAFIEGYFHAKESR